MIYFSELKRRRRAQKQPIVQQQTLSANGEATSHDENNHQELNSNVSLVFAL